MSQPKTNEYDITKKEGVTLGGAAIAAAAIPTLRNRWYKGQEVKLNPETNRLLLVTEGGPKSFGGKGHETTSKSIAQAWEKKHGIGSVKIINQNDYMLGDRFHEKIQKAYMTATNADNSSFKRSMSSVGFYGSFPVYRAPRSSKVTEQIRDFKPSRVIVTHPDAVNFVKQTGIRPEIVITDYGVGNRWNKKFWNISNGWIFKDNVISRAYAPSNEGMDVFKDTPTKRISTLPIRDEFFSPKAPLSELTIWDNAGNELRKIKKDPTKKMIAISGGSTGTDVKKTIEELLKANRKDAQLYVVTGTNKKLKQELDAMARTNKDLIVQGFDKNWKGALDTADLAVLRSHGLTPTEAMARKIPVISTVTDFNNGRWADSYAPHMVGNAEHYNREFNSPIAALKSTDSSKSLTTVYGKTLDDLANLKAKVNSTPFPNAAEEIVNMDSATKSVLKKISPLGKGLSYGVAGGLGSVLGYNTLKQKKQKEIGTNG